MMTCSTTRLLGPFEGEIDFDWDAELDLSPESILTKSHEVCSSSGVGACGADTSGSEQLSLLVTEEQLGWSSECYVCRSAADYIEEQLVLYAKVSESLAGHIVSSVCSRLLLVDHERKICESMTTGDSGDTMAWSAYHHRSHIDQKRRNGLTFGEQLCAELSQCSVWIDPAVLMEILESRMVEAVYL